MAWRVSVRRVGGDHHSAVRRVSRAEAASGAVRAGALRPLLLRRPGQLC